MIGLYFGFRTPTGAKVWRTTGGRLEPLPMWQEIRNHSLDGPEWGYSGSGPAQLALALLMDATADPALADGWHQEYKRAVIASLDRDAWMLSREDVLRWVVETLLEEGAESIGLPRWRDALRALAEGEIDLTDLRP
jgi:hypothetical protein